MNIGLTKYCIAILFIFTCHLEVVAQRFLGSYLKDLDFSKGAAVLEPDLISTSKIEFNTSFDIQSETLYYTISTSDWSNSNVVKSHFKNGKFSKPENVLFGNRLYSSADVHIHGNGKFLFFVGENGNIWRCEKFNDQWSTPAELPETVNSEAPEAYPMTTSNGNLYFARFSSSSSYDIYVSKFDQGEYEEAIKLPNTINSDLLESDAWVAPDESFMIFARKDDPDGYGVTDLYISFNRGGQWSKAKNLGKKYNSVGVDGSPWLSADYKYLFFTSTRNAPNPQRFDGGLDLYVVQFNLSEFK